MIATEAAAEGINLQFCSMVVNYDLPWNPQRIEQRIGRCHRYGQQYDVVVVNFLNKNNAADQRVYELLAEKFKLFSGVFGASDEVLGAIESGRRVRKAHCRHLPELPHRRRRSRPSSSACAHEMDTNITATMEDTRRKLLENFDAEVHDRLKINMDQSKEYLDRYARMLWAVNVINRENDRMSGRRPIEFIQAANPIVIIDEPQSVDTHREIAPRDRQSQSDGDAALQRDAPQPVQPSLQARSDQGL